jgi:hypothetical protein
MATTLPLTPLSPTDTASHALDAERLPNGVPAIVDRDARLVREALTRCRRDVSSPITDARVSNLIKKVESGRAQPARLLLEMMFDAFERGAPREAVEAVARTLLAITDRWYVDRGGDAQQFDFLTLVREETAAQAAGDVGEMEIVLNSSRKTLADALPVIDAHLIALQHLSAAGHRRLVAA